MAGWRKGEGVGDKTAHRGEGMGNGVRSLGVFM